MHRINRPEELEKLRKAIKRSRDFKKPCITVCSGTGCHAYGCEKVTKAFSYEINRKNLTERIDIRTTGCHGFCAQGPIVVIYPEGIFYQRVKAQDVQKIVSDTIIAKKAIDHLLYIDPVARKRSYMRRMCPFTRNSSELFSGTMV